ncbi:MAG TPA: HAMP domain-containing histidine kinase, partial [Sediminispirochaeta sp.]|nr:HAMP domain-containing histidine kinase [Sediminispirochaeta sp.]
FYIIMEGEVEVWKDYDSPYADLLAVHGEGKLFGEMALVDDLPRSATVLSRSRTRVLFINEEDFQQLLKENPSVALAIIRSLSAMVRKSNQTFVEDLRERNRQLQKAYDELQAAQAELLKNERLTTLGKFSSMILHDIRNPISIIRAFADMLRTGGNLEGRNKKYVENIAFETERLNQLANELLDYSRGEIRLDMGVVEIPRFLDGVCEYAEKRIASKNITIKKDYQYQGPGIFDGQRMFRVFSNLVENSRKALNQGGELSVSVKKDGENLVFAIRDNGIGMSEEVLRHVFEPFFSSSSDGGTGLGMAIVKSVVDAHHGSTEIDSQPGKGTEVRISLPLRL